MTPLACNGEIKFDGVGFVYPTRPDINVLKGLSVTVCRGQTLALVGQSGCGKSTCIQLLERFYNATTGRITVDGVPINQLSVKWLRSQIGFVQQEPVLFDCSIKDNILYGSEGIHDDSSIRSACEKANALDFITGFQQEVSVCFNYTRTYIYLSSTQCAANGATSYQAARNNASQLHGH